MGFTLPIIPMTNIVFYPNTSLPLYVVDPVCSRMIKDCVNDEHNLGIALTIPTTTNGLQIKFKPRKICGYGQPVILDEAEDGALKVLVKGLGRAELGLVQQNLPYLVVDAQRIPDENEHIILHKDKMEHLREVLYNWVDASIHNSAEREAFEENLLGIKHVVDYICMFIIQDTEIRQLLLENVSLYERVEILNLLLKGQQPLFEDHYASAALKNFEYLERMTKVGH